MPKAHHSERNIASFGALRRKEHRVARHITCRKANKSPANVRYSWGISRILNQNSVNSEFVKGRPKTSRSFFTFFIFTTAQTFLQDRICLATSKSRKFQSFFIAKKFYCFSDSWDSDILANIAFVIRYQNKFA